MTPNVPTLERLQHYLRLGVARKFAATLAARVLMLGLGLLNVVLTARLLGPEGRGALAVALTVVGLGVQLGCLGLPQASAYFAARDRRLLPSILGNALAVSAVLGGAIALLSRVAEALVTTRAPLSGPLLWMALLWIPVQLWFTMLQSTMLGLDRLREYNALDLWQRGSFTLVVAVLLLAGEVSSTGVFFWAFVAFVPGCLWASARLARDCPRGLALSRPLLVSSLGYAYKVWVGSLSAFVVVNADLMLVSAMRGAAEAGWYSVDAAIASSVMFTTQALSSALFPTLAEAETFEVRWRVARKALLASVLFGSVLCVAVALAAPAAIALLVGPSYHPAVGPLYWLLPGVVAYAACGVVSTVHAASEHTALMIVPAPLLALLNVGLNLVWIPRHGITGAAVSSSVTYVLWLLVALAYTAYYRRHVAASMDARRAAGLTAHPSSGGLD